MYIGMDSGSIQEMTRWNTHLKHHKYKNNYKVLYLAMRKYGSDNFICEIVEFGFETMTLLSNAEIQYIKQYNTITPNGYNLTEGGDGGNTLIGYTPEKLLLSNQKKSKGQINRWINASQDERENHSLKSAETNYRRWNKQTFEEKQIFTNLHLHSITANTKRSKTIELEWAEMSINDKSHKLRGLDQYRAANKEAFAEQARINGNKATEKTAASFIVRDPTGNEYVMKNKSQFKRDVGIDTQTIKYNTRQNRDYKGWWLWNIDEEGNKIV